ncbi:unnamed protein product [Prorocentrum cordatum]|uniref:AMP-dependent synthetase/ligase domain-containing protein n=1 Tax=Prorocentrum cordatum TaxID=2364126 RepID=A0ABN9TTT7_9DINO|nr:unnamed protein product [Polarella glacialis]
MQWSWPARVDAIAGRYGDCLGATDDTGAEVTWKQLRQLSEAVSQALLRRGLSARPSSVYPSFEGEVVAAPTPVCVMMPHTVEALAVILGVLRRGFPLLPLSVLHGDRGQLLQRYQEAMELFEPALVVSDSPLAQELVKHRPAVEVLSPAALLPNGAGLEGAGAYGGDVANTLDSPLAYIFTSGSTGKAKCVTATNRMAWAEVQWYPQVFKKLGARIDPRTDRWRQDHEMGWWGAAYFGEVDVALAMEVCIVMMKSNDTDVAKRGVTIMGALPSQLQNLWPGANNIPKTLRVVFSWAERCDVDLGDAWKRKGVKMVDLLIASEFWLSLASCNMEAVRGEDGRAAHAMRALDGPKVLVLGEDLKPLEAQPGGDVSGLLGIGGASVSPGYAELLDDGTTAVGAGPLSKDTFKVVDGELAVVPKDLVKKRADNSFLSIGRGGGTVKVKGGVLMATNVVELQLQRGSIAAACITDPVHVGEGSSVVLQINWQDAWSLRDCFQQVSFLRMPTLFTLEMPRNQSTGKVQKALVQAALDRDLEAEAAAKEELRRTQLAQLAWFARLSLPALLCAAAQPCTALSLRLALCGDARRAGGCLLGFVGEAALRLSLVAWAYGALGHSANLAVEGHLGACTAGIPLVLATAAGAALRGAPLGRRAGVGLAGALVSCTLWSGCVEGATKKLEYEEKGRLGRLQHDCGRLRFAVVLGLAPRLLGTLPRGVLDLLPAAVGLPGTALAVSPKAVCCLQGVAPLYSLGLCCIFAANRRLPAAPRLSSCCGRLAQRLASAVWSALEAPGYMLSFVPVFYLSLPHLVIDTFYDFAQGQLQRPGQPVARQQSGWPYAGPRQQLRCIKADQPGGTWDSPIWFDVTAGSWHDAQAPRREAVQAKTPAGERAQQLARQAGVDFHSVDSLKIARLSVLLKRGFRAKPGEEPVEFAELREACASEEQFLELVDGRMLAVEEAEQASSGAGAAGQLSPLCGAVSWARGGCSIHREGPTPAPWDCQVDMTMEWRGSGPLDLGHLSGALGDMLRQHALLRARPPPDDKTDELLGTLSTLSAASWALACAAWSAEGSWTWSLSRAARWMVTQSLWRCWPRTLVACHDDCSRLEVKSFSKDSNGWERNVADEVHQVLSETWEEWWNPQSMVNACVITLKRDGGSRHFLYTTVSHKYADGGAAAFFVRGLSDAYEARLRGAVRGGSDTPVLRVQQERLWAYLQGQPCPRGSVDAYFKDVDHDSFSHGYGYGLGVQLSRNVCDVVRAAGARMAASEEVAWLACLVIALFRLMPDEPLVKVLMVHNGRLGDAEGVIACTSQYVVLSIPCTGGRSSVPLADVASRVKWAVANGRFSRPAPCEQTHAKINIGGMLGSEGDWAQVFKTSRPRKKGGRSRAQHVLQLRMDNEGDAWCIKDFKLHQHWEPKVFWEATICAAVEIAEGWFVDPMAWGEASAQ